MFVNVVEACVIQQYTDVGGPPSPSRSSILFSLPDCEGLADSSGCRTQCLASLILLSRTLADTLGRPPYKLTFRT